MLADAWLNRGYCERASIGRSRVSRPSSPALWPFGPPDAYPVEFGNIGIFERLNVLLDLVIGLDVMPSPGRTGQAEQDGWGARKASRSARVERSAPNPKTILPGNLNACPVWWSESRFTTPTAAFVYCA